MCPVRPVFSVAFPPVAWAVAFAAITIILYWSWRLYTFRVKLRPLADSVLVGAATGLLMQGSNFGALLGPPITAALVSADGWPAAAWLTSTALGTVAASGIFLHRRERRKVDT